MANSDSAAQNVRFNLDAQQLEFALGLEWTAVPSSGSSAAGDSTQIQFNTADAFDASADLTYDGVSVSLVDSATTDIIVKINPNAGGIQVLGTASNVEGVSFQNELGVEKASITKTIGGDCYIGDFETGLTLNSHSHESLRCSATGGITPETMNTAADTALTPTEGTIWYNSQTHAWRGYNGTAKGTFTFIAD